MSQVTDFWAALIEVWQANPTVQLREAERALISPELAGFRSDRHSDFACGNVLRTPLDHLIRTGMRATWVREYQRGIVSVA